MQQAAQSFPESQTVLVEWGRLLVKCFRLQSAVAFYHQHMETHPSNATLLMDFVSLLRKLKRFNEAIALLGPLKQPPLDSVDLPQFMSGRLVLVVLLKDKDGDKAIEYLLQLEVLCKYAPQFTAHVN